MTSIIVTHENNEIDEHDFEPEIKTITIGRRSTNDVCIPNASVSGTHAKITLSDTGAMVEDLSSTNGTYINGRLISRQLLNDGDDIVLGKARVTFLQPNQKKQAQMLDRDGLDDPQMSLAEKARVHKSETRTAAPAASSTPDAVPADDFANRQMRASNDNVDIDAPDNIPATNVTPIADSARTPAASVPAAPPQDIFANVMEHAPVTPVASRVTPQTASQTGAVQTSATYDTPQVTPSARAPQRDSVTHDLDAPVTAGAVIEIKNGAKSGQVLPIDKPVTTLGRPGIQIAAIMKKPDGYFLMHIESDENVEPPQLNRSAIGDEPVLLKSGDALNVAGIDVQFMLS